MSEVCRKALWRVLGGWMDGVQRLSRGYGKAVWRV